MFSLAAGCGYDPEQTKALNDKLRSGELIAFYHKLTARVVYATPDEAVGLSSEEYRQLTRPG